MKKILALLLVLCMLLSGCTFVDFGGYFGNLLELVNGQPAPNFSDMVYTRPDMTHFQQVLDDCLESIKTETDLDGVLTAVYDFYEVYDSFYTGYALSNIRYSLDLTDTYWETEYNYCSSETAAADAGLDSIYRALAKSPLRSELESPEYFGPDFFDMYEGETLYDDTFQAMLEREAELQNQYYAISAEAAEEEVYSQSFFQKYGSQLEEVYVEMIRLRQQIARYAGYESYPEFAYSFYFGRDYSCQQAETYLEQIRQQLTPLYQRLVNAGFWTTAYTACTEAEVYAYVQRAAQAMGGTIQEAFAFMEAGGLYDISYNINKFPNSFEIYVTDYASPYIFLNPSGTNRDKLAFTHEFGHFCNDYASYGKMAGIDVAEVFSQGMEYLSLCYVENSGLEKLKMADSLQVYVVQAAYASFEQQVYALEGAALSKEAVRQLYQEVMTDFDMTYIGFDSREYVYIPHFFVAPMYVISYVVSNDVAMQMYMLEQQEPGKGLACLENSLTTMQSGIQGYVQEAGLMSSPFADGWLQQIKATLEKALFP